MITWMGGPERGFCLEVHTTASRLVTFCRVNSAVLFSEVRGCMGDEFPSFSRANIWDNSVELCGFWHCSFTTSPVVTRPKCWTRREGLGKSPVRGTRAKGKGSSLASCIHPFCILKLSHGRSWISTDVFLLIIFVCRPFCTCIQYILTIFTPSP